MRAVRAISGFPTTLAHTGEGISLKEITGVGVSYDAYYTRLPQFAIGRAALSANALATVAVGAFALAALAIGRVVIGRLTVGKTNLKSRLD